MAKELETQEQWSVRVFGSLSEYRKTLPKRHWVESANGWTSHDRSYCKEHCQGDSDAGACAWDSIPTGQQEKWR